MTEPYFEGDLIQNEMLNKVARQRRNKYHEITVPKSDVDSYLEGGWEEKRPYKRSVRLRKAKPVDELLEDEVWLLFKNMGFTEMNKDRDFRIQAGSIKKQIDVFASDATHAFVVECKTSVEGASISRRDILEIASLKKDIRESVRKHYKNRAMQVSFVIATRNINWSKSNSTLAKQKKIFAWKEAELVYYHQLIKQLGTSAKFQIYSILFRSKKIPQLKNIRVPAIRGGRGTGRYYCFVIQPEKLLQVAYVHHREASLKDIVDSYQRMLAPRRLGQIDRFISSGGYFRNNIIISFTKPPKFERKEKVGDIVYGILEFPPYYSCAWIIDGQHRLYGYKDSEKRSTHTIPVVAFDRLQVKEQAKLFVEINKEQKAVPANLLWDLYPDIYYDSPDKEHQLLRAISLVVKRLNSDSDSPLRDHVRIPSVTPKGRSITNLTMATVCQALQETELLDADAEEGLLHKEDYDSTIEFAAQRLKAYFDTVTKAYPQDWAKGNQGLLRTNIGIRILFIILKEILLYFRNLSDKRIYIRSDLSKFRIESQKLLGPMLRKLDEMGDAGRNAIRKQTAKGLVLENAKSLAWEIKEEFREFGLELLKDWAPPVPEEESHEHIKQLLEDTEIMTRLFVIEELKKSYNAQWYPRGIPAAIKKRIDQQVEKEIDKDPRQRAKLLSLPAEQKLNYTTIGDLKEVIRCRTNWKLFEDIFGTDKGYASAQFTSFERLRNIYAHHREETCDEIEKRLGYWGVRWIAKRIGLDEEEQAAKI